jgi:hypothetical protein
MPKGGETKDRLQHLPYPKPERYRKPYDFKPARYKHFLTTIEVARVVHRHPVYIRRLEAKDKLPRAMRVPRGKLSMRLWSPEQVEEIKEIFAKARPGNPTGANQYTKHPGAKKSRP